MGSGTEWGQKEGAGEGQGLPTQTWQDARWAPKPNCYFSEEAPA